ncbi:glycosyl transferase family 20 [Acidimicrobium ferrooxidans DSM 10331]|uniref:Glycosyl transferase family 20 n=1 Tax=Acidimicrobium ferrooxidans (strain DSM 10331 / JCM 15462 / NBRC 103882 / ICP) TaxID=525909 RepID=C7M1B5_ACIFD|nr:trehalose-6-phosphate synthase [Acidimicrobium ferrooxidans]ACU54763.1 glycosyl transferase family 20 [Acidimicrobium ferrooxidans DSM 10331]
MAPARQYLFVTNRGPFAISPSGSLHEAGGGLAAGLRGLLATGQARSVFAVDDGPEREHWSAVGDDRLIPAAVPEEVHRSAYDTIANELLWYCAHQLFDLAFEPIDDAHSRRAWSHYETFNELMAEAAHAVANVDDVIVVNDYHLYLVPRALRARGWQGTLVFFLHIPVPTEQEYAVLPAVVRRALLDGIAEADLIAVHAPTWAERLRALFDASGLVAPPIVVAPLPVDVVGLLERAARPDVAEAGERLDATGGALPTITRVDRIEPSKNLLRGVAAIDRMLELRPDLAGRFRALHLAYPSRGNLDKYHRLRSSLVDMIDAVNDRWRRSGWVPIEAHLSDDPARSIAAYQRFRVLLVNPVRDGLNLVAPEASLLAPPDAHIVLSRSAGIAEHIGDHVTLVDPFDVDETARALIDALERPGDLEPVRRWVHSNSWDRWLATITPTATETR